jgi:CRISPR/Cas system-associated endoribonuclease Cas2
MTELKNSFQQREAKLNKQIETTRAEADRELCDLRRQLNRVQDSHVEFMEQVEKKHAEELSINFKFYDDNSKIFYIHLNYARHRAVRILHRGESGSPRAKL